LGACRALLGDKLAQPLPILLLVELVRHARYTARGMFVRGWARIRSKFPRRFTRFRICPAKDLTFLSAMWYNDDDYYSP
jgi:hypothetical protein